MFGVHLMRCLKSTAEGRKYVRDNFGIEFTRDDLRLMRSRLRAHDHPACDLQAIRELLRPFGPLALSVCEDNSLNVLSFTSDRLIEMNARFCEV